MTGIVLKRFVSPRPLPSALSAPRPARATPWRLALPVCAVVTLTPLLGVSATFHARLDGDDRRSCATATVPTAALRTIPVALACARPGDTVQVGPGVWRARMDVNATAGGSAAGGKITIEGTLPIGSTVLDGTGLGNGWMIYGRHVQHVRIRHFEIRNHVGGGIGFFGSNQHVHISDNYIHNNTFLEGIGSAIRVTGRYSVQTNRAQGAEMGTAAYIAIARNRIEHIRTGFMGKLPNSGSETLTIAGDVSHFAIVDNLLENGQFIGIDLIGKSQRWWGLGGWNTRPIPATPWPRKGIVRGNTVRNLRVGWGAPDVGIYCDGCSETVFEHNRVENTAGYCYAISTEEDDFLISQIIVRHNVGINCPTTSFGIGPAASTARPEVHGVSAHLRVVHNTGLKRKPGGPVFRFQFAHQAQAKNNIAAVASAQPVPYLWHGANVAGAAPLLDYTLYWGGNHFFEYKGRGFLSFPAYQAGSGQDAHGLVADPRFTNVATGDVTLRADSPARERGTVLTTTTSAGSGPVVAVHDARYFTDGYGVLEGDQVRIGTQEARITRVDYATHRLTLDRPLTWGAGVGVSYPFQGAAPDLGACEYGTGEACVE